MDKAQCVVYLYTGNNKIFKIFFCLLYNKNVAEQRIYYKIASSDKRNTTE